MSSEAVLIFNVGNGSLWLGDCLDLMSSIPDGSVDMILCDLPYGTTACAWDTIIPFEPLWKHYWRVAKPNAAIVLTASQPFTSALVMSQPDTFKYDWIWKKQNGRGHLNAKKMPLRDKEDVAVFYRKQPVYNPQMVLGMPYSGKSKGSNRLTNSRHSEQFSGGLVNGESNDNNGFRYPRQILNFNTVERGIHPTQKPVALFEYLIKTYTNEGAMVLDNCSGSGTTAVAAQQCGRRWLCIEKEPQYFYASAGRIWSAVNVK